jgi:citrate synthase
MSKSAATAAPTDSAELRVDGQTLQLPVIVGTEDEKAVDIRGLRGETGFITLDPGYVNTGSCTSSITFIDGERGILRYRGIPIEQLGEHSTFVETSFLLIYGHLPTAAELDAFSRRLTRYSMLHEDMKHFFSGYPSGAHPMAILSAMICSLSAYYEQGEDPLDREHIDLTIARLMAKVRTIAAFSYKKSKGHPFVYPEASLPYCANLLHMLFHNPSDPYFVDPEAVRILNLLFILHADHEQNCSTSTVRLVGSSGANLYATISAGVCALWGPLHGGANQAVLEMLQTIHADGGDVGKFVKLAKDKDSRFRLMGFGHRVYKNYDPRAKIIKEYCDRYLDHLGIHDPLLDIARRLEEAALKDSYFVDRKLYPNVDFYSGIIYRAMGIPTNMFTVMFAIGRLPGWLAHWKEMVESPDNRIGRPRQIYTGELEHDYISLSERS